MDTLPLRIKAIRALDAFSAILLVILAITSVHSLMVLNQSLPSMAKDATYFKMTAIADKMTYLTIPLWAIFAGLFSWQTFNVGKLNQNAYWTQMILSVISVLPLGPVIAIAQLVVIVLLLPAKTRETFGIGKK
jgi:hypothetical protein